MLRAPILRIYVANGLFKAKILSLIDATWRHQIANAIKSIILSPFGAKDLRNAYNKMRWRGSSA